MRGLSSFHGGHSSHGDGEGEILDIARAAVQKSFRAFGFSEHFDRPPSNPLLPPDEEDVLGERGVWTDAYVEAVKASQAELASVLPIRLGTEIDYIRGAREWTEQALSDWPFEYLVGSVHYMRFDSQDICIDCNHNLFEEALRRSGDAEQLQLDYYNHVLELLEWDLIQIVGHLDLIKLYLTTEEARPTPAIRGKVKEVLRALKESNVALDLNSGGLREACREIYPASWILKEAAELEIPITLGDDSHSPEQVGEGLDAAVEAIASAGYSSLWIVQEDGSLLKVSPPW